MAGSMFITGDADADALLNNDGTALLIGMLLDQQVPLTWAFAGPATLRRRLGHLDAATIAATPLDEFVAVCCAVPAIHRFPAVMARRIHSTCEVIARRYGGDGAAVWADTASADVVYRRLLELPGFADEKARITIALLAKRFDVRLRRWTKVAGVFSDRHPRTIADVADPESLDAVRAWKAAQRTAGLDKQDRPK